MVPTRSVSLVNVSCSSSLLHKESMVTDPSVADQRQTELEASTNKTTIEEIPVLLGK